MPIADLLGVQFDMQLLVKLSFSVAAVLLVSWAYRFYRSRDVGKIQPCGKENRERENTASHDYQRTKQHGCFQDKEDEAKQDSATDDLKSDSTDGIFVKCHLDPAERRTKVFNPSNNDQNKCMKKETFHQDQSTANISTGHNLTIHDPSDNGMAVITGRRSPCLLKKLEGGVGVGRELRQDLEHQGVYSSFLSKAEIKVEDAKVILEGSGDKTVSGKIYDYYIESSSHSFTDSKSVSPQYERNTASKMDYGEEDISFVDSPLSVSPIVVRDLVFPQSKVEEDSLQGRGSLRHPGRPALLRKESYLSAAEQSEHSIPFQISRHSSPMTHYGVSTSNEDFNLQSSTDKKRNVKGETDKETIAGASLMGLPAAACLGTNLDILKSKLDLGNCLEILYLAKKKGLKSVQHAALEVMSDNYLQVLRDPNLYGRLMADERERIRKQRMRGRRFVTVADMDPQDWLRSTAEQRAKSEQRSLSSAMYYYDDYKDAWHSLCLIPQEVISKACAMCTMDNYLFVAVGGQGSDREMMPSKRVFCYNPLTSIWKEICPMNQARPRCKLAALEGYIYAIGGECLSTVERYNPRQDRWTFVAPLPNDTFAVAHHATVCHGELFVSGGTLRYILLRYNPKTNTWRPSLIVGNKDKSIDMVAVGRFLYRFDINPLLGVSVYRYHTVARLWYECSSKRLLHCPAFQCIAMDDTVYCLSRHFTMRFEADEISPAFADEELSVLSKAKGLLFPFVLSLPDKNPRQTSV